MQRRPRCVRVPKFCSSSTHFKTRNVNHFSGVAKKRNGLLNKTETGRNYKNAQIMDQWERNAAAQAASQWKRVPV